MKRLFDNKEKQVPRRNERNVFDYGYQKKNVHNLPQWYAFALVTLILGLSAVSKHLLFKLPNELTLNDIKDNPNSFISERSWVDLKALTDIGPRPTGSYANEVLAVNFLKREINLVQQLANPIQKIHAEVQTVSGGYWLGFKPQGMTTVYRNIQNVVVKLAGENEGKSNHSLLLNCHFDTVPGSTGASDDGGSCVVMLEILRVLSRQNQVNKHSIIFLFNGAEETSLQASHGFITQHPWAPTIRAFINIESAGSNGKEILFQTGPQDGWLVDMYRKSAPHPFGNTVGEELFQSGFIPSDTDFRIFRDFGNIPGLDLSHPMNGYRYHTKYDRIDYISKSCLQRTGDNVLGLVKNIANSAQLGNIKAYEEGTNIYYDLLGLAFVSYSKSVGIILNILVGILSVLIPYVTLNRTTKGIHIKYIRKQMFIGFFNNILAATVSSAICYGIASELDYSENTMSWYSNTVFADLLYVVPVVFTFCIIHQFVLKSNNPPFSLILQIQARLNGTNVMWSVLLLTLTALGARSAYMFLIPLIITLISNILIGLTGIQNSIRKWLYVHIFNQFILILWTTSCYHLLTGVFVPMIGQSGGEKNPEIVVAAICLATTIYSLSFIIPLIGLLNKTKWIFISLLATFFITRLGIIGSTNIGFPYNDDSSGYPTPQRHYISHTTRTVYNEKGQQIFSDFGFWIRQVDRNTRKTIESLFAPDMPVAQEENIACSKTIFCGLPFHSMRHLYSTGYWIPGPAPMIRDEASLILISNQLVNKNERELKFTLSGNVLVSIGIQPRPGVELIDWNITDMLPAPNDFLGKKVYLIAVTNGLNVTPMNFTLKFKVDDEVHTGSSIVDMMLVSYYWEYHKEHTPFFTHLLNKLPSWAFAVPSVSSFKSWMY